jgi:hypothetical protein
VRNTYYQTTVQCKSKDAHLYVILKHKFLELMMQKSMKDVFEKGF